MFLHTCILCTYVCQCIDIQQNKLTPPIKLCVNVCVGFPADEEHTCKPRPQLRGCRDAGHALLLSHLHQNTIPHDCGSKKGEVERWREAKQGSVGIAQRPPVSWLWQALSLPRLSQRLSSLSITQSVIIIIYYYYLFIHLIIY